MNPRCPSKPRTVVFLGSRGIPNVQGGIETHVANLAARLARRGWRVEVLGRAPYLPPGGAQRWNGVTVTPLWAPRSKYLESLLHTGLGLLVAAARRPDIVHIHAIGPALLAPLARLLGLRVVVTHHGFDYDRQKWGWLGKAVLRLGEKLGMACAHGRIGVSRAIAESVRRQHGHAIAFIPNGVEIREPEDGISALAGFGLTPGRYILSVARIVEEKRQLDLIAAFRQLGDPSLRLVLAGSSEHGGAYFRAVNAAAAATPGVVMAGFQGGETLAQLFAHAGLFVLPSSHEGMPIALLEALGHGVPVLASDIAANLALELPAQDYFPLGDVPSLAAAMGAKLSADDEPARARAGAERVRATYAWDRVVERTAEVYEASLSVQGQALPSRHGMIELETKR